MSPFRTAVLASLVIAAIVAGCSSPSSPAASQSRQARLRAARARPFAPLTGCTGGNVSIQPCNTTLSAAANKTNDSVTIVYGNTFTSMQGYDVACTVDGTVILSCTPDDSQPAVPARGNIHVKYHFATRAAPGTGTLDFSAEDLNNGNFAGSTLTVTTH